MQPYQTPVKLVLQTKHQREAMSPTLAGTLVARGIISSPEMPQLDPLVSGANSCSTQPEPNVLYKIRSRSSLNEDSKISMSALPLAMGQ